MADKADLGFEVAVQGLFARPLTKARVAKLCGLLGLVLVLAELPWPAYVKTTPFGLGQGLFWATLVLLVVCKGWAVFLLAQTWLARVARFNVRARAADINRGGYASGEAERANDPERDDVGRSHRPPCSDL